MPTAPLRSQYAFALCQPGAEPRLKAELRRLRPAWQPAFQRPGLVTFKAPTVEVRPDDDPHAMFARAWGCSGGLAKTIEEALVLLHRVSPAAVFVGPRQPGGEVPEMWQSIASAAPRAEPRRDDLVLDVIVAPAEPPLIGWHVHGFSRHLTPSGIYEYVVPAAAPSRAYGKAIESLRWSGARLTPGDLLIEIGAAPGGTTLAYLEHDLRVLAVDTQDMAPVILAHPGCAGWIRKSISEVTLEELPTDIRWIAVDAGIAPTHVVRALRRFTQRYRRTLRGLLLTLKLNDEAAVASVPKLLEELRHGGAHVDAIQLPTHRNDLLAFVDYTRQSRD